jgi:hypothetical protein
MMFDASEGNRVGDADGMRFGGQQEVLVGQGSSCDHRLPTGRMELGERLNLSDLKFNLDREAEWQQIYSKRRQMRLLLCAQQHGVVGRRCAGIMSLSCRCASSGNLHHQGDDRRVERRAYVCRGGDMPRKQRIKTGCLEPFLKKMPCPGIS